MNKRDLWIGIGIGATVGVTAGIFIGNSVAKSKAREELKRVRKSAYIQGVQDGGEKSAERIAELESDIQELSANVVFVNSTDSPDDIQKRINEFVENKTGQAEKASDEGTEEPSDLDEYAQKHPDICTKVEEDFNPDKPPYTIHGMYVVFSINAGNGGTDLYYPKTLIYDQNGDLYAQTKIRENFRMYESDIQKLRFVWRQMGWGSYVPDLDGNPYPEDIDNWDLEIDGDIAKEPEEKTAERERYLDKVDQYLAHPESGPRIISEREFKEETHLEQIYVDYFDVDNQFAENTDPTKIIDAFTLFGTTDGEELFNKKVLTEDDQDPDIIHVENFGQNCVIEVTRFHKSYASMQDGSAYVNGVSD